MYGSSKKYYSLVEEGGNYPRVEEFKAELTKLSINYWVSAKHNSMCVTFDNDGKVSSRDYSSGCTGSTGYAITPTPNTTCSGTSSTGTTKPEVEAVDNHFPISFLSLSISSKLLSNDLKNELLEDLKQLKDPIFGELSNRSRFDQVPVEELHIKAEALESYYSLRNVLQASGETLSKEDFCYWKKPHGCDTEYYCHECDTWNSSIAHVLPLGSDKDTLAKTIYKKVSRENQFTQSLKIPYEVVAANYDDLIKIVSKYF